MGAKIFSRISLIPRGYLWPSVFVFCLVGSYGLSQSMVDVYIMLISGVMGFFLRRYGFSPAPIIMGIVLGELVENSLAQSIIIFDQNIFMFFTRPICLLFFGLTFLSLFYRPIKNLIMKGKKDE
jgi:putative tricarboxylic transport membrane protein